MLGHSPPSRIGILPSPVEMKTYADTRRAAAIPIDVSHVAVDGQQLTLEDMMPDDKGTAGAGWYGRRGVQTYPFGESEYIV